MPRTQYSVEGSVDWDLDVWGRIRRQVESQISAAQVSAADLANAQLSAQATLATDYFDLRAEDSLADLLRQTVAAFQRALQIVQNQHAAGTVSSADVVTAQAQLEGARAQLVGVGVQRATFEHAIAVLTGHPPADLTIPFGLLTADVPVMPPGVPSTLLQRRPDIAAAERQMQQQNALIGVQVAAFYPDVTLSALVGFVGSPLSQLFTAGNRIWSLGGAASETIFEGGARSAAVAAARATYDQSVANYRQVVLTALQQVEDELSSLRILRTAGTCRGDRRRCGSARGGSDLERVSRRYGRLYKRHYRANHPADRSADPARRPAESPGGQCCADRGSRRWMERRTSAGKTRVKLLVP